MTQRIDSPTAGTPAWQHRLGRMTFATAACYWALTSLYGAIASQAFVQEQFLGPGLFPPLTAFARWHAAAGLAALAAWMMVRGVAMWSGNRHRGARGLERRGGAPRREIITAGGVLVGWLAALLFIELAAPLADALSHGKALAVAAAGAGMMIVLAAAEWRPLPAGQGADRSRADLAACLLAGGVAAFAHTASTAWLDRSPQVLVSETPVSLGLHLLLAGATFLVTALVRSTATLARRQVVVERALSIVAVAGGLTALIFFVLLASISVRGPLAFIVAFGIGAGLALAVSSGHPHRGTSNDDGVMVAFEGWSPRLVTRWWGFGLYAVALFVMATAIAALSRRADWNFVLARSGVALIWLLAFGAALRVTRGMRPGGAWPSFGVAGLLLAVHLLLPGGELRAAALRDPAARWLAASLERRAAPADTGGLAALLHANTNIPRDVAVAPVSIEPSPLLGTADDTPHVFLFVIDSLRRDYLSPYNPAVTFTPSIAALARDSLVFRNAFTQYGATGLSVPALWVGGPLLHKQYVRPFWPMNSLARLLAHEGYAEWIGMDNIMEAILPPSTSRVRLDAGVAVKDYRLCDTLADVTARLDARPPDAGPVFVYALPQDLHVAAVAREGGRSIDEGDYEGFYAPVASRLARLDACLGDFIEALKARDLYERSIIVLTSDHGDSLGEEGRMGHAYSLHPEIVRVPLIVHVPPSIRSQWTWDEARVAFTSDITPTLHRLLGHDWTPPAGFFGEPLARQSGAPAPPGRDRMVAASYGAVYGAVLDGGTRYYVFDAVAMRELGFAIDDGPEPGEAIAIEPGMRARGMAVIRDTVERIGAFYRFPLKPPLR